MDAPSHHTVFDNSVGLNGMVFMILLELFQGWQFFNLCSSVARAEFCEWILVGSDVYTFF